MVWDGFHPLIADWFTERFGAPTEPQRLGWPSIAAGRHTLIAAPTGSGKTLAAFLVCIDRLWQDWLRGCWDDRLRVLYVSPLKALSNDIERNLQQPLTELAERSLAAGHIFAPLRTAVRTGDTPSHERQAQLRKPPQLLVTTPESLYLLLTAPRGRAALRSVQTVIVDEIHALARDKRGSHLALSLERLAHLTSTPLQRIGLSATQRPLERMAQFLVGSHCGPIRVLDMIRPGDATRMHPMILSAERSHQAVNVARPIGADMTKQTADAEAKKGTEVDLEGQGKLQTSGCVMIATEVTTARVSTRTTPTSVETGVNSADLKPATDAENSRAECDRLGGGQTHQTIISGPASPTAAAIVSPTPLTIASQVSPTLESFPEAKQRSSQPPHLHQQDQDFQQERQEPLPVCESESTYEAIDIVDAGHMRLWDLALQVPESPLGAVCSHRQWDEIYARLVQEILAHRSTLIFVNTRRFAERIAHRLREALGEDAVAGHHGSLSKEIRWQAEQRLKAGSLKAIVATASLEMGIDVGAIDLVCQIGSPRSIATFLQRIGRSGHSLNAIPKGRIFPLTRDELLEAMALIRAVRNGRLDAIEIPVGPLDVLAQQIVAAVSVEDWDERQLLQLLRRAWPYRDLSEEDYASILRLLSEGLTPTTRQGAWLHRDRIHGQLRARNGARLAALTSGGAIPEAAEYRVVALPEKTFIGKLDEHFAVDSSVGDVFLLGNTSWRVRSVQAGEVLVEDAEGAPPNVPFWFGESPGRTIELSEEVSQLRAEIARRSRPEPSPSSLLLSPVAANSTLPSSHETLTIVTHQQMSSRSAARGHLRNEPGTTAARQMICPEPSTADTASSAVDISSTISISGLGSSPVSVAAASTPIPTPTPIPTSTSTSTASAEAAEAVAEPRDSASRQPTTAQLSAASLTRWLDEQCGAAESVAWQAVEYVRAQMAALGLVPTCQQIVFERFFDESGGMQLVIHAPLGARINRAWGLALRKRFCRSFDFELQAAATDNGIVLSIGPQHSFPIDALFQMLGPHNARYLLEQAVLAAPMFQVRWRWNVTRALAVLRTNKGQKVPPHLQRFRSDDLLAAAFPETVGCLENHHGDVEIPDHPLVRQTMHDCLTEAMDLPRWVEVLEKVRAGQIELLGRDTREPSPFCYELLNASPYAFLDDAPLEERRTRAVATRRSVRAEDVRDLARLDDDAIAQVRREAWPVVRSADELHDALLALVLVDEREASGWEPFFVALTSQQRASTITLEAGSRFWFAAENWPRVRALFPSTMAEPVIQLPAHLDQPCERADALVAVARGRLQHSGPLSCELLAATLCLDPQPLAAALEVLEARGLVLRGRFTAAASVPLRLQPGKLDLRSPDAIPEQRSNDLMSDVRSDLQTVGSSSATCKTSLLADACPNHPVSSEAILGSQASRNPSAWSSGQADEPPVEWCDRRLLARIHRLTLEGLRRRIQPVPPAAYMAFLLRHHRVEGAAKWSGHAGLRTVLEQLQGYESPAGAWERSMLPARLQPYDPQWLDQLFLSGEVAWGRLYVPRRTEDSTSATNNTTNPLNQVATVEMGLARDDDLHTQQPSVVSVETRDTPTQLHEAALPATATSFDKSLSPMVTDSNGRITDHETLTWMQMKSGDSPPQEIFRLMPDDIGATGQEAKLDSVATGPSGHGVEPAANAFRQTANRDIMPKRVGTSGDERTHSDASDDSSSMTSNQHAVEVSTQAVVAAPRRSRMMTRNVPLALVMRRDLAWLLDPQAPRETPLLTVESEQILAALRTHGALFWQDLAEITQLPTRELDAALRELAGWGQVTSDAFAGVRNLVGERRKTLRRRAPDARSEGRSTTQPYEAINMEREANESRQQLQAELSFDELGQRPVQASLWETREGNRNERPELERNMPLVAAKTPLNRARERDASWRSPTRSAAAEKSSDELSLARSAGRWARFPGYLSAMASRSHVENWCRQLLRRYGVVMRDLLARETAAPAWRELVVEYRRMELRGEVCGGRFISDVAGEQFAEPATVEQLRMVRDTAPIDSWCVLSAADPLNLSGLIDRGPRIPATHRNRLIYRGGRCIAARIGGEVQFFVENLADFPPALIARWKAALETGNVIDLPTGSHQVTSSGSDSLPDERLKPRVLLGAEATTAGHLAKAFDSSNLTSSASGWTADRSQSLPDSLSIEGTSRVPVETSSTSHSIKDPSQVAAAAGESIESSAEQTSAQQRRAAIRTSWLNSTPTRGG